VPGEGLAEGDAEVLGEVVHVHLEVARRLDGEPEPAVAAQLVEHVGEEGVARLEGSGDRRV
jgi:hypothetical protein